MFLELPKISNSEGEQNRNFHKNSYHPSLPLSISSLEEDEIREFSFFIQFPLVSYLLISRNLRHIFYPFFGVSL